VKQTIIISFCSMICTIIVFSAVHNADAQLVDGAEICRIIFNGNTVISDDTLDSIASEYSKWTKESIHAISYSITTEYENKGYLWTVVCPSETCKKYEYSAEHKSLTINIIEGKLGDVNVVRPVYMVTDQSLEILFDEGIPELVVNKMKELKDKVFREKLSFKRSMDSVLKNETLNQYQYDSIFERCLIWANYIVTEQVINKISHNSSTPGFPEFIIKSLEKNIGTVFVENIELQKGLESIIDKQDLAHYGTHLKRHFKPFEIYILTSDNLQSFYEQGFGARIIKHLKPLFNKAYLGKDELKKEILPIIGQEFWEKKQSFIFKKTRLWPTYVINKKLINRLKEDQSTMGCPKYVGEKLTNFKNHYFVDPAQFEQTLFKQWSKNYTGHFVNEILKNSKITTGYYSDNVVKNYFEPYKKSVLNETDLENSLLKANQTNKIQTQIWLQRGKKFGFADIQLRTREELPVKCGVDFNNFGSEFISKNRYGFYLDIEEPGIGGIISFRAVAGDAFMNSLASFSASVPINKYGTRFSLEGLSSQYAVGKDLVALNLDGNTQILGAEFSHGLYSKKSSLVFHLGYKRKYSEHGAADFKLEDEVDTFHLNIDGDYLDSSRRKWIYSLGGLYGSVVEDEESSPNRTNYTKDFYHVSGNLAIVWMWQMFKNFSSLVSVKGQLTDSRLLPLEEFVIGGFGNVRGHDPSMYIGDSGFTASNELMYSIRFSEKPGKNLLFQLAAFFDYGGIFISDPQLYDDKNEYLGGYGGGLRIFYGDRFQMKFDVGLPVNKQEDEDDVYLYVLGNINFF